MKEEGSYYTCQLGSGKTRTAMNMIRSKQLNDSKGVVLWLAHSEELCEQAADEFETAWSFLGDRTTEVGSTRTTNGRRCTTGRPDSRGPCRSYGASLTNNQTAMHWLAQSVS